MCRHTRHHFSPFSLFSASNSTFSLIIIIVAIVARGFFSLLKESTSPFLLKMNCLPLFPSSPHHIHIKFGKKSLNDDLGACVCKGESLNRKPSTISY
jgi:hypothetical protein